MHNLVLLTYVDIGPWMHGNTDVAYCQAASEPVAYRLVKFGDDRLRGFWWAGSQSSPFPIDFDRRPYNSATLPRAL